MRHVREEKSRTAFLLFKYGIFNLVYIPIVVIFREMLFAKAVSTPILVGVMIAGQIGILIYDKAYDYVQVRHLGKDARKSDVIKNDIKRMSHISAAHGGKSLWKKCSHLRTHFSIHRKCVKKCEEHFEPNMQKI